MTPDSAFGYDICHRRTWVGIKIKHQQAAWLPSPKDKIASTEFLTERDRWKTGVEISSPPPRSQGAIWHFAGGSYCTKICGSDCEREMKCQGFLPGGACIRSVQMASLTMQHAENVFKRVFCRFSKLWYGNVMEYGIANKMLCESVD